MEYKWTSRPFLYFLISSEGGNLYRTKSFFPNTQYEKGGLYLLLTRWSPNPEITEGKNK